MEWILGWCKHCLSFSFFSNWSFCSSVAIIKSNKDTGYALDWIVTHDGEKLPFWPLANLKSFRQKLGTEAYEKVCSVEIDLILEKQSCVLVWFQLPEHAYDIWFAIYYFARMLNDDILLVNQGGFNIFWKEQITWNNFSSNCYMTVLFSSNSKWITFWVKNGSNLKKSTQTYIQ